MKKSVNSNMYTAKLDSIWALYDNYLYGEYQALVVVLSSKPLSEDAHAALLSSFERLGYGKAGCTFVVLQPEKNTLSLSDKELFVLLEGLDPKILVVADKNASMVCGQAYKQDLPLDARLRLFGRETRVFSSFESMITQNEHKQKAWALLKTLPRLSS